MPSLKEEVLQILDTLPEDATWEDVHYALYVRERIDRGIREADESKILDESEVE